ncbi:glutaredoxin family protein [Dokdonella koreensis]|uniref:Glutaredoxin n=1 Tax=Dokdonella koreensis DS-123 TaxID=1300342 RepID=A0A167H5V7_9GAMM|nr:glutaredoxin family protein [Dokdonella koreensis]ANB19066.1 Glutaredoxin [Dokdonella koreensis DS-123]
MLPRLLAGLVAAAALAGCERQPRADASALRDLIGAEPVVLLSTDWCGYCGKLRNDLGAWGVDYREIDVERSAEGQQAFALLRSPGVPVLLIGDEVVHGYTPRRIRRLLADAALLPGRPGVAPAVP